MKNLRGNIVVVVIVIIAIVLILGMWIYGRSTSPANVNVGGQTQVGTSTVVTPTVPSGWQTGTTSSSSATFSYPSAFPTTYVDAYDWPPVLTIRDTAYTCTEAGVTSAPGGKTEKRTIDGKEYCVTSEMGGAAGSTYTQYAYATDVSGKEAILTFTVRSPQCGNYEEPKKSECANEEATFDLDAIVSQIMQSIRF